MIPIGKATPKVKNEHLSDDDDSLQKQIRTAEEQTVQAKKRGQGSKGERAKKKGWQSETGS